ncbi:MAG: hypothetical protein M1831_006128 [Alyxoria varia]|nr:MAG: hypothetical protein M1831_006128 [Alyxoria varia]
MYTSLVILTFLLGSIVAALPGAAPPNDVCTDIRKLATPTASSFSIFERKPSETVTQTITPTKGRVTVVRTVTVPDVTATTTEADTITAIDISTTSIQETSTITETATTIGSTLTCASRATTLAPDVGTGSLTFKKRTSPKSTPKCFNGWATSALSQACSCLSIPTPTVTSTSKKTLLPETITDEQVTTKAGKTITTTVRVTKAVTNSNIVTETLAPTTTTTTTTVAVSAATPLLNGLNYYRYDTTYSYVNSGPGIDPGNFQNNGFTLSGRLDDVNALRTVRYGEPSGTTQCELPGNGLQNCEFLVVVIQGFFFAELPGSYTFSTPDTIDNDFLFYAGDYAYGNEPWTRAGAPYNAKRAGPGGYYGGSTTLELAAGELVPVTMIWANVDAIKECERFKFEPASAPAEPSLTDPQREKPIAYGQIIDISRYLEANVEDSRKREFALDELLRGSEVYDASRSDLKTEPRSEYHDLMARLRRNEEAQEYDRMFSRSNGSSRWSSALNSNVSTNALKPPEHDENEEEMTYTDVNRQVTLIINVLVTIIACGIAVWLVAYHWSTPKRLALSMSSSIVVGVAEVAIYIGYLRRLGTAKVKERKKKEKRFIMDTWILEKSPEVKTVAGVKKDEEGDSDLRQRKPK